MALREEQKTSSCTATSSKGGALKKQLLFHDKKCTFPTSQSTRMSMPTYFENYNNRFKNNTPFFVESLFYINDT